MSSFGVLTCTHAAEMLRPFKQWHADYKHNKISSQKVQQLLDSLPTLRILKEMSFVMISASHCWFPDPVPWNFVKWALWLEMQITCCFHQKWEKSISTQWERSGGGDAAGKEEADAGKGKESCKGISRDACVLSSKPKKEQNFPRRMWLET